MGTEEGDVFVAKERFFSRILNILVQPVSDLGVYNYSSSVELGYIMVYTLFSIHWYCVKYDSSEEKLVLRYVGRKQFKTSSITSASWSPHFPGECLVLLENGEVLVFDLKQRHCRGCKMKVSWENGEKSADLNWLGCKFGWRLGMYIIARSDAVFVINKTSANYSVRSLLEVESLSMAGGEEFVGFAKAGSDRFRFILVSQSDVFLCDQRSSVPLLKWQHNIEKPCFMDVYSLSELGFGTDESTTSCVIIGSFWNAQCQIFCYGPSPSVVKDPSSLYVWELPHNILLPAGKCICGDCVISELRMKESLLEWTDWQKKRVLVLGFGVLNKHLPLGSSDQSSGFTLIRLTSSGKLEALKFCASCDPLKSLEVVAHIDPACKSDEVNLLYLPADNKYKLQRRFKYIELEYLSAHAKKNLAGFLDSRMKSKPSGLQKKKSFSLICHEELCEKLKICGFGRGRTSAKITTVLENISSPTSVYEIALRYTWSSLPVELLLYAFSNYSEFEDVLVDKKKPSLEFSVVPESPQLPPFFLRSPSSRSSKWSKKEQPGVELVGPLLPLPILITLDEFLNPKSEQELSPEAEFSDRCNQISKATSDEILPFIAYRPITNKADSDEQQQQEVSKFVSRVRRSEDSDSDAGGRTGLELFSDMSPVEIGFEDRTVNFDTKALLTSKTLLAQWQRRSSPYQNFLSHHEKLTVNIHKR